MRRAAKICISMLCLTLAFVPACSKRTSDTEQIREAIRVIAKAAREKDVSGIMKHISRDYRDGRGNDYKAVKGIVFVGLMRGGSLRVFIRSMDVEVKGERALAEIRAVLVRGSEIESLSDVLPEDAEVVRFDVVFAREKGAWLVVSAEWKGIGALGLI